MKNLSMICLAASLSFSAMISRAMAHGDEVHAACKKGYVMTDDHRCVKRP